MHLIHARHRWVGLLLALLWSTATWAGESVSVAWFTDKACLLHDAGQGHPESAQRLQKIQAAVDASAINPRLLRLPARVATRDDLLLVHPPAYLDLVRNEIAAGKRVLSTGDVRLSAQSHEAASAAVGCLLSACDAILDGQARRAFCAVRPPGHHAEPARGMGFCLYANVAIAAQYLLKKRNLSRVLVIDIDVHNGNGTYAALKQDKGVFQFHFHQHGIYPGSGVRAGSGRPDETGEGDAVGNTINISLPKAAGDDAFIAAIQDRLVPAMATFKPEFILVSAGYDAHTDDPLGGLTVTTEGYRQIFTHLVAIAEQHCAGRLIAALEGGYNHEALAASVVATLVALHAPAP